ncbi:MAG TPA: hypothetical protein VGJ80_10035 [Gemmatimonadales bacterium]|jgi:uncharacterized membrane protein
MLMIVLRFAHVVSGALWVGMFAFMTFFLMPAFGEAGPEGAKVMAAMAKRRIPVIMPLIALITLVSGFWLFQRLSGGQAGALMATPVGKTFGIGGLAALVAFLVGVILGRPVMMRSAKLAESLPTASPADRPGIMAEMQRLRARGTSLNRVVMALLLIALTAMAIARYI